MRVEELRDNIIDKNSINVARNTPIALVVGAAGFLGSHIAEGLIEKNLQVIGVDNFSTGKKEHLSKLSQDKKFHFLNINAQEINLDVLRLDYIFITTSKGWKIDNILTLAKEFKSKIMFISPIELYDRRVSEECHWYKETEAKLAKFASEYRLNARVVRLATLFGPRMTFTEQDPMVKLIKAALLGEIQNESASLEFSSRALFITDAVKLIIKSMLAGSTALKIFDGVGEPVKVSEIKQILLDPSWHASRGFKPIEIPPWPTPNLIKTKKELGWQPQADLVKALAETLNYFKNEEVDISKLKESEVPKAKEEGWEERIDNWKKEVKEESQKEVVLKTKKGLNFELIGVLLGWGLIVSAFFYPLVSLGINTISIKINLSLAQDNLKKGQFDKSLANLNSAEASVDSLEGVTKSVQFLPQIGLLKSQISFFNQALELTKTITRGSEYAVLGAQGLQKELLIITTGISGESDLLANAQLDLERADGEYAKAEILLTNLFIDNDIAKNYQENLNQKLISYAGLVKKMRLSAQILPELTTGNKSYLILFTQNGILRGGGGVVQAASRVDFTSGKLKKVETVGVKELDEKLTVAVETPPFFKDDLPGATFNLSSSGWEPDLPTNARKAQWIYQKETGATVNGVIYLDTDAISSLLASTGGLEISGNSITGENLKEKLAKEPDALSQKVLDGTLRKILFISNYWDESLISLADSLDKKHLLIYFSDPDLLNLLSTQNLVGQVPRPASDFSDFLLVSENNLSGNLANKPLKRDYHLQTNISSKGQTSHSLRISYLTTDQYQSRLRLYLPAGTKLTKALWGENNLLPAVTSLVDFGRQVYSLKLELIPGLQKNLILSYEIQKPADLLKPYRLDVIKQPGTGSDSFVWDLTGLKKQTMATDLSEDRSFEVLLK